MIKEGLEIKEIEAEETYSIRHQVMWPNKPLEFVILDNDDIAKHFGLFKGYTLVSVISLFTDGKRAQFRKFATLSSFHGNGYGSLLLKHLLASISQTNVTTLWCNARKDKTSFYERFGLTQTSNRFVKSGVSYVIMEMIIRSKSHLINSDGSFLD